MTSFLRFVFLISAMLLSLHGNSGNSQAGTTVEYQVKAAFLYHFANFVDWPSSTFKATEGHVRICLLGKSPFGEILAASLAKKTVGDHAFNIQENPPKAQLQQCHILYLPDTETAKIQRFRKEISQGEVLTVGETFEFIEKGGMVQFFLQDKKVKFAVNPDAINQTNLKVSSKLLRLAKIVSP